MASHASGASHAAGRRSIRVIGEYCVLQEMLQRGLDDTGQIVIIAARLPDSFFGFFQRQDLPVPVLQSKFIDIGCKGFRHAVGKLLFFLRKTCAGRAEIPLIGPVRDVQIRDRAPAHGPLDRIAHAADRADLLQIRIIEGAVAGSAEDRALCSAAAHADAVDIRRRARKDLPVITDIADCRLQIRYAEGSAVIPSSAPCKSNDHAFLRVVCDCAVTEGTVIISGRRHSGIARRVDRKNDRSLVGSVVSDSSRRIDLTGEGSVAVVLGDEITARHKEPHGLIDLVCRFLTVRDPGLVVDVIVRVVLPLRHIDQRQLRRRRILLRFLRSRFCLGRTVRPGSIFRLGAALLFCRIIRLNGIFRPGAVRISGVFRPAFFLCCRSPCLWGCSTLPRTAAGRERKDCTDCKNQGFSAEVS